MTKWRPTFGARSVIFHCYTLYFVLARVYSLFGSLFSVLIISFRCKMESIDRNSPCERDHEGSRDQSATDRNRSGTDCQGDPRSDLSNATDSPCEGSHAQAPCRSVTDRTDGMRRDLPCSTAGPDASVRTPTIGDGRDEPRLGKTSGSEASRDLNVASDGGVAFRTRSHGPLGRSVEGPQDSALDRMVLVSGCREPESVRDRPRSVRDGLSVWERPAVTTLASTAMVGREPSQWSMGAADSVRNGLSVQDGPNMSAFDPTAGHSIGQELN